MHQALLHFLNPVLQVPVLLFQSLDVTPRSCATSNSIGRPALCVILQTWRASAGEAITPDLAHLWWDISVWARDLREHVQTLQRSHAWPVLDEDSSFFLTAFENSSGCSVFGCFAGVPLGSSDAVRLGGIVVLFIGRNEIE